VSNPNVIKYPVSRIVREYLIEQGVGAVYSPTVDWSIATAARPKRPLDCITIYDEAEEKRGRFVSGIMDDPTVVIEVRSVLPEPGAYRAKLCMEAMDALDRWTWVGDSAEYGQTVMFAIARRSRGVFPLGQDDNGRWIYNLEYAMVVQSITE